MRRLALVITSVGSPQRGGGAARSLTILGNYWAGEGRAVRIFSLADEVERPCFPLDDRIDVVAIGGPGAGGAVARAFRTARRVGRLRSGLRDFRPDAIISFLTGANVQAILASRGSGVPVIVCERTDPRQHRVPAPYGALRTLTYPWADVLVVQSERAAACFGPRLCPKVAIIPNVVPPSVEPKVEHRERADRVLSVGHLLPSKDHRTLVEAVARLKDRCPALQLTIFGEGPERAALTALVRSRGLEGRVWLPGFTTGVPQKLRDFDLFVFPSRYEGFPNALGEAMSAGLPVIASTGPGHDSLVADGVNGRMFRAGDVDALASTIAELHGDRATREALGAAARGVAQTFSETRVMALWARLLESC